MTTIVYRDGVMAADRRAYAGDKQPIGEKTKVHRLADGSLFGASSSKVGAVDKFRRLVEERGIGGSFDAAHPVQAILVRPDGSIFYFHEEDTFTGPLEAAFIAIGSGDRFALGALKMGATAARAVEVAIECDVWSGGGIDVLSLGERS